MPQAPPARSRCPLGARSETVTLVVWGMRGSVPSGVPGISKQEGESTGCKIALTHVRGS